MLDRVGNIVGDSFSTNNRQKLVRSTPLWDEKQRLQGTKDTFSRKHSEIREKIAKLKRIHSVAKMNIAGFEYIGDTNTARCNSCGLEISQWTPDMEPIKIHTERSPMCSYILCRQSLENKNTKDSMTNLQQTAFPSNDSKQSITTDQASKNINVEKHRNRLIEVDILKEVRKRTFSNWPTRSSPSSAQMIEAGFFSCNISDRVICIYCNLICQQWTPNSDNPREVHQKCSPKCPYVFSMLLCSGTSSIAIINGQSCSNESSLSMTNDLLRSNVLVYTAACNLAYIEIPRRHASFTSWPKENLPSVEDLVKAGFFYTGTNTTVTCFYCGGSLQNWGPNDNPIIEHARWFPHCPYARQLCGVDLYRRIQESKQAQKGRTETNDASNEVGSHNSISTSGRLLITDESTLSRLVAARLDLPISQSLLDRSFKLSVIKRCLEDQLRLKRDDFVSDYDMLMACIILQKQIDHIGGKKENIIVPRIAMAKIREEEQAELRTQQQPASQQLSTNTQAVHNIEMTNSSSESTQNSSNSRSLDAVNEKQKDHSSQSNKYTSSPTNPCSLCLEAEKCLASIPCGHLSTCVPCGHSLRTCPICRQKIDAFVRIYL